MVAFLARDEAVIEAALRAGVVPAELRSAPVRSGRAGNTVWLEPAGRVKREVKRALETAGFEVVRKPPAGSEPIELGSWAEVISARRGAEPAPPLAQVLFVARVDALPDSPTQSYLELAGELIRLGCDRQELTFFRGGDGAAWFACRAVEPPYYVVLSAMNPASALTAYVPVSGGAVWIQVGFEHPLAGELSPIAGELLLIGARPPWRRLPNTGWIPLYERLDLQLPQRELLPALAIEQRLRVELRLVRSSRPVDVSLWVLRRDPIAQLDQLVASLPERVLATLAFAQLETEQGPIVVIRARRIGTRPPVLELAGAECYAPLDQIENLHLPIGTSITPPLRFERLQELCAPIPTELVWAVALEGGSFRLERAGEDAFVPLLDWVVHAAAQDAGALAPWLANAVFELDEFVALNVEWADGPAPEPTRPERPSRRRAASEDEAEDDSAEVADAMVDEPSGPVVLPALDLPAIELDPSEAALALERLETEFRQLDARANSVERVRLWVELAMCYGAAGRAVDAGLAWTHALWEIDDPQRRAQVARRWAEAEREFCDGDPLALSEPPRSRQVRAVAAHVVAAYHDHSNFDLPALNAWLRQHDHLLDTRAFWLVREVLAELTGGDQLARVQAQDAVLHRLRGGLSGGDEVPAFIRTWDDDRGLYGHALEFLAAQLERLHTLYRKTKRARSAIEADPKLTDGYVEFLFAWGFARLGRTDATTAALDRADSLHRAAKLDAKDPVHAFLRTTFRLRVTQALDGLPIETPLPAEIMAALEALERYARYKVDRLREASVILDWTHDLDPFASFGAAAQADAYADLADPGPTAIAAAVDDLLSTAGDAAGLRRAVTLLQVLPEFYAVPRLHGLLEQTAGLEPADRVDVLENAMLVAARCESVELVQAITAALTELIEAAPADEVVAPAMALSRLAGCLHRARQSESVLVVLQHQLAAIGADSPELALARLQMAAAMAKLGDGSAVESTTAAALTIPHSELTPKLRLQLIRQIAQTLSHTTPGQAAKGVEGLMTNLPSITDSFNTNSHFCLSVLHFMESMVCGLARADLSLSPAAQQFIEEDEHRIRRRIFAATTKGHPS